MQEIFFCFLLLFFVFVLGERRTKSPLFTSSSCSLGEEEELCQRKAEVRLRHYIKEALFSVSFSPSFVWSFRLGVTVMPSSRFLSSANGCRSDE